MFPQFWGVCEVACVMRSCIFSECLILKILKVVAFSQAPAPKFSYNASGI
jgi:hypothetical protein